MIEFVFFAVGDLPTMPDIDMTTGLPRVSALVSALMPAVMPLLTASVPPREICTLLPVPIELLLLT